MIIKHNVLISLLRFYLLVVMCFSAIGMAGQADVSSEFPYELSAKPELILGGLIIGSNTSWLLLERNKVAPTEAYIASLSTVDLLSIDQNAITQSNETARAISDYILVGEGLATSFLILHTGKKDRKKIVTLGVMYTEALALTWGTTYTAKNGVDRARPLLYNQNVSLEDKLAIGTDAKRSFYSGHSSVAFCTAVFGSQTFSTLYPNSKRRGLVWAISLSAASTVGILRYKAGKHFPTDIIVGAGAGSLIGYAVERMHRKGKNERVSWYPWLVPSQQSAGLGVKISL
jgi:membrane-associated phospholipid phosphatase